MNEDLLEADERQPAAFVKWPADAHLLAHATDVAVIRFDVAILNARPQAQRAKGGWLRVRKLPVDAILGEGFPVTGNTVALV